MTLKEIYTNKKIILNNAYAKAYQMIYVNIDNDEDIQLSDDESDDLIVDLMLSNILGEIVTYDEVKELLKIKQSIK